MKRKIKPAALAAMRAQAEKARAAKAIKREQTAKAKHHTTAAMQDILHCIHDINVYVALELLKQMPDIDILRAYHRNIMQQYQNLGMVVKENTHEAIHS